MRRDPIFTMMIQRFSFLVYCLVPLAALGHVPFAAADSPGGVPGPRLHLDASNRDSLLVVGGGLVSAWGSGGPESSMVFTAMTGEGLSPPRYEESVVNGRPALRFRNAALETEDPSALGLTNGIEGLTVIAVAANEGGGTQNLFRIGTDVPPQNNRVGVWRSGGQKSFGGRRLDHGPHQTVRGGEYLDGAWEIDAFIADYANGRAFLFTNGEMKHWETFHSPGEVSAADSRRFRIGSNLSEPPGGFLNGHIAEFLIFDRVLSAEELHRVGAYLGDKYGIAHAHEPSPSGPWAKEPAEVPPPLTQEQLDVTLQPVEINTNPGPEYSDEARDYAMVIGLDRTPGGRLWAAWVAGGDSEEGYFVVATSDDDGATWSEPRLVIDPPNPPFGVLKRTLVGTFWTDPNGRLWLFFDQSLGYFDGRAGSWAITCDNPDDDEPVWSEPRRIWHGATLNKPLVLDNGEWLLPISLWTRDWIRTELRNPGPLFEGVHRDLDPLRKAHIFVSTDQGETWKRRGGVAADQRRFDEHMYVKLADGRLWMLIRTYYGLAESFSSDLGRTWTEPVPSRIKHVERGARVHLRRLESGRLLLVKHGRIEEQTSQRSHLMAFLSDDDGKTWSDGLMLDERTGVSYPDGFQAPDGTIYIIYDRNRATDSEILMARFTEEDILEGRFHTPRAGERILVNKALGGQ